MRGKAKFCKLIPQPTEISHQPKGAGLPTIAFYKNGEKVAELTQNVTVEDVEAN